MKRLSSLTLLVLASLQAGPQAANAGEETRVQPTEAAKANLEPTCPPKEPKEPKNLADVLKQLAEKGFTLAAKDISFQGPAGEEVHLSGSVKLGYKIAGVQADLSTERLTINIKTKTATAAHPAVITTAAGVTMQTKAGGSISISGDGKLTGKNTRSSLNSPKKPLKAVKTAHKAG